MILSFADWVAPTHRDRELQCHWHIETGDRAASFCVSDTVRGDGSGGTYLIDANGGASFHEPWGWRLSKKHDGICLLSTHLTPPAVGAENEVKICMGRIPQLKQSLDSVAYTHVCGLPVSVCSSITLNKKDMVFSGCQRKTDDHGTALGVP
ncbi:hypothetical protein BDV93DRAFT_506725 [Ceratobasidium sp. AG-I]|nr:hypothetical protein BDV93DRAFT_506725 [Ceratobasidium sp. AG-I]